MAVIKETFYKQILQPGALSELFTLWNRFPDAVPFAGGTTLIRHGSDAGGIRGFFREQPELPPETLSLEKIDELRAVTRTERYLEIGTMVRLNEIIALGKIVPGVFSRNLEEIGGPQVRNLATIGGNIWTSGDTTAPLSVLDARYELRNGAKSRWIPAIRFSSHPEGNPASGELLTRIRIPLDEWNYTVYRKFQSAGPENEGGVLILLVRTQKNMLSKIQAVFAGGALLRDKNTETYLEGKALPLNRRDAVYCRKCWENYLEGLEKPGPLLRTKIVNAVEAGIAGLAE